jgi:hypothetical protein
MPWPLYILGNDPQHTLNKRMLGPQSGCGHVGEEVLVLLAVSPWSIQPIT